MVADVVWEGVREFADAVKGIAAAADIAGEQIVRRGGQLVAAHAKEHMGGRPGPNTISGTLRASLAVLEVTRTGPGAWESQTGPTAKYGRRIELGFHGTDSAGRHYNQGPFPYLRPGLEDALPELGALYGEVWRTVLHL